MKCYCENNNQPVYLDLSKIYKNFQLTRRQIPKIHHCAARILPNNSWDFIYRSHKLSLTHHKHVNRIINRINSYKHLRAPSACVCRVNGSSALVGHVSVSCFERSRNIIFSTDLPEHTYFEDGATNLKLRMLCARILANLVRQAATNQLTCTVVVFIRICFALFARFLFYIHILVLLFLKHTI